MPAKLRASSVLPCCHESIAPLPLDSWRHVTRALQCEHGFTGSNKAFVAVLDGRCAACEPGLRTLQGPEPGRLLSTVPAGPTAAEITACSSVDTCTVSRGPRHTGCVTPHVSVHVNGRCVIACVAEDADLINDAMDSASVSKDAELVAMETNATRDARSVGGA